MYAGGETLRVQFALRETLSEWEALAAEAGACGPKKVKRAGAAVAAAAVPGVGAGSPARESAAGGWGLWVGWGMEESGSE